MSDIRFVVVIPTRDRAELVTEAVALVLQQTHTNFRLVVVDDGGRDDTVDRLKRFGDSRLSVVSQPPSGVCTARNFGAAADDAPWITFCDSDDRPHANWLESFAELIDEDPYATLVAHGLGFEEVDGTVVDRTPKRYGPAFGNMEMLWLPGAFAIRRDLFERVEGFDPTLHQSEHTDLALRVADRCGVTGPITNCTSAVRHTMVGRAGRYDAADRLASACQLLETHDDRFGMEPSLRATYHAMAGVAARRLGQRRVALQHLARAILDDPSNPRHPLRLARVGLPG